MIGKALVCAVLIAPVAAAGAAAADKPRYDVPAGFERCADATAWNGFFKWASVDHTSCRYAADFMRAYARAVPNDGTMPREVRSFHCSIRYWRNEDGDVYASRHRCERGRVVVRFYGMV
jgi:hypothetical protein